MINSLRYKEECVALSAYEGENGNRKLEYVNISPSSSNWLGDGWVHYQIVIRKKGHLREMPAM